VGCWHGYLPAARCKCKCFAYGPAGASTAPSSLASLKSRMDLPFWCQLTQVFLEKQPLSGCLSLVETEYGYQISSRCHSDPGTKCQFCYSAAHTTHRPVYGSQSHGSLPTKPTVHSVTELLPECAWVNPRVTICVRITCVQASFKHRQHCLMVASFIICDPW